MLRMESFQSTERMTLEQDLKRWLNDTAAPSKRAATVEQYERIIRHVAPHVGRMQLDRLTPLDVQGLLRALECEGKSVHLRGLVYVVLHAALKQAVLWDLVPRNATEGVKRPRSARPPIQVLTAEQADRLLGAAESSPLYALYVLALTTGMRRGDTTCGIRRPR